MDEKNNLDEIKETLENAGEKIKDAAEEVKEGVLGAIDEAGKEALYESGLADENIASAEEAAKIAGVAAEDVTEEVHPIL